jgi:hypothetical protein
MPESFVNLSTDNRNLQRLPDLDDDEPSWRSGVGPRPQVAPCETQRVTAADLRGGQIRISSIGTSSTKHLFPDSKKATLEVALRGRLGRGSWDPTMAPDRERLGVLWLGVALRELVRENEVLIASVREDGIAAID